MINLTHVIPCLALAAGIYRLFAIAEDSIKTEIKEQIANWLLNVNNENWASTFSSILRGYFGENYFSFRALKRSIKISIIFIIISSFSILLIAYFHKNFFCINIFCINLVMVLYGSRASYPQYNTPGKIFRY